jgi:N-acetyl-1-D-myo-inositol-2-amino-2-deoxy-alpha-D-glucopyranoside deacetylase/mycothiol S-conjugate amidase
MSKQKTLIFVGAHPDDETFSVGATLAYYAGLGEKVYYVCATRGEVGQTQIKDLKGYSSLSDLRCSELKCAAKILGITEIIFLNFRDSGMSGWKENKHPQALISRPLEEIVESIVKVFRKIKPDVIITFDPNGGYFHPDHIVIHNATVRAFEAAGDATQFNTIGIPFSPKKLYFHITPRPVLRIFVKIFSLIKIDLGKIDKNRRNLVKMVETKFPIHAVINLNKTAINKRNKAASCHQSMLRGKTPYQGINGFFLRLFGQRDYYMRGYPPVKGRLKVHDLFENLY